MDKIEKTSSTSELSSLLTKYKTEFEEDVNINELNLRERQMMLPGIKHKYVAYLIQHKQKKYELESAKKKVISELLNQTQPDVGLSTPALVKKHEGHPTIKKINSMIEEQDIIILYLEKIENITRNMTYDLSNMIKIIELETT